MWWTEALTALLVLTVSFSIYCWKRYRYFEERGVCSLTPLPLVGSFWRSGFFRKHFLDDLRDGYNAYPDEKYVGAFEGLSPVLLIRDPELIKKITVKDFDHFVDHRNVIFGEADPLLKHSLIMLKGKKWKDMRGALSPAFTGSKMKLMVPFMSDISKQVVQFLHEEVKSSHEGKATEPKDLYDLFTRYTNDVIASCAFGFNVNSLKDQSNDFYKLGRLVTTFKKLKFMLFTLFPRLCKLLRLSLFPPESTSFFRNIVASTMSYRKDNNVNRPDMIQLLMEAKNGALKYTSSAQDDESLGFATVTESTVNDERTPKINWSDDELAAQAFIFFFAGFDTTATALTFAAHELTVNPDVQRRLRNEVDRCHEQHSRLTYQALQGLTYMDMVISETLRKWASAVILDRECLKEYQMEPPHPGGKPFILKPRDCVYVLVNALQMDPQNFPDPHKFDPERFSDERKHEIKPFTFLPFGSGPRNCIGSRFALMELKVILYQLLLEFELVACDKTTDPIRLALDLKISIAGGAWIQFKPRN